MIHIRPESITPHPFPPASDKCPDARLAAAAPDMTVTDAAAALSSRGLSDVLAVRLKQIELHGHTIAADDAVSMWNWRNMLGAGLEHALPIRTGLPLGMARKRLVRLAAFILAMIDRIDREQTQQSQAGENNVQQS